MNDTRNTQQRQGETPPNTVVQPKQPVTTPRPKPEESQETPRNTTSTNDQGDSDSDGHSTQDVDPRKAQLDALLKKAQHGDRKITEQGQQLSEYRQRVEQLERENQQLRSSAYQQPRRQTQQQPRYDDDDYGYDDNAYQQPANRNGSNDEVRILADALRQVYAEHQQLKQSLESFTGNQRQAEVRSAAVNEFGLQDEHADVFQTLYDEGNYLDAIRLVQLAGGVTNSREQAQAEQQRQRRSAGMSPATGSGSTPQPRTNSQSMDKTLENIRNEPDELKRHDLIAEAVGKDRRIIPKLAEMLGLSFPGLEQ